MEIDLQNLPEEIKAVLGNMPEVFNVIYTLSTKINEENGSEGEFIFIMPDGVKILFRSTATLIQSLPGVEIEFEILEKGKTRNTTLYLSQINKSAKMSGTAAMNYAITIASMLGAASINLVDLAHVLCKDSVNEFPLSLYRVLTTESLGWYANIAKSRNIPINMTILEKYGFHNVIQKLKSIQIDELLTYYTEARKEILKGMRHLVSYKINLKEEGGLKIDKISIMEADKTLPILKNIYDILLPLSNTSLIDFLKNPDIPCKDKSTLLGSLPGFSQLQHFPEAILDKKTNIILIHPYLNEFLRLRDILQNTTLKLKKGGSKTKKRRSNRK
jgi:hypothetical protein